MSAYPARKINCDAPGCDQVCYAPGDYDILARTDAAIDGWTTTVSRQLSSEIVRDFCPVHSVANGDTR